MNDNGVATDDLRPSVVDMHDNQHTQLLAAASSEGAVVDDSRLHDQPHMQQLHHHLQVQQHQHDQHHPDNHQQQQQDHHHQQNAALSPEVLAAMQQEDYINQENQQASGSQSHVHIVPLQRQPSQQQQQQEMNAPVTPTHPFELPEALRHLVQSQTTYTYGNNVDQCFVFPDKEKAEQVWCALQFDTFARRRTTPDTLHGGFHAQHSNLAEILECLRSHPDYVEDDALREAQRKLARYPSRKWKTLCVSMESRLSALNDEIQPAGSDEFGSHFIGVAGSKRARAGINTRQHVLQSVSQQDPKKVQHKTIKQRWMCSSAVQTSIDKEMERCRRRPKAIATLAHDVLVLLSILQRAVVSDPPNNSNNIDNLMPQKVILPYGTRDQLFHEDNMNKRRWQVAARLEESALVYQTDENGVVPEGAGVDAILRGWAVEITNAFKEINAFVIAAKTRDQHTSVPVDAVLNGLNAAEHMVC
jgi:hypothetical protein